MTDWKPGDVAMVTAPFLTPVIAMWDGGDWNHEYGRTSARLAQVVRPLVVIDPDDTEQVKRLADAYAKPNGLDEAGPAITRGITAALREFASQSRRIWVNRLRTPNSYNATRSALTYAKPNGLDEAPTPPRPDEPTGLGAVVEDTDGKRWVKVDTSMDCDAWTEADAGWSGNDTWRKYDDLAVVRVLSPGVAS